MREWMESTVVFVYIFHVVELCSSRFGEFPMKIGFSEKTLPVVLLLKLS